MGIVAKFIPLPLICLLVFTPTGREIITDTVEWASDKAAEWGGDRIEDTVERGELRQRLAEFEPACDADLKPSGFDVTGSEAIALAARDRKVDCDLVDLEPMSDAGYWSVHFESLGCEGCEFSAEVDATTRKVSNRFRDCDE